MSCMVRNFHADIPSFNDLHAFFDLDGKIIKRLFTHAGTPPQARVFHIVGHRIIMYTGPEYAVFHGFSLAFFKKDRDREF